jgi:hypothetical protein
MKPKLLSINQIYSSLWGVFLRFPLAVITVLVAAFVSMFLIEQSYQDLKNMEAWIKLLLTSSLALPFFVAVTFITETTDFDNGRKKVFHVVAFIIVFLYYWHFDDKLHPFDYLRTFVLNIAIHLFVAYSPYLKTYNENGFWQFNKTLFLRFLLSALYSGVLYSGLSIALLAVDNLFDVKINEKVYFHLWVFIAIIFNSVFFLAGIPQNVRELDSDASYPKGLKVFTQFVLLPLVTVYLLILYVYGFKILVSWELPRGWVSYLVMCFSVAGIFSLLMIHPVKDNEQNKWINIYARWYYRLLFPLLLLLAVAIYVRVENYGITENRYFLIALAIWLFATIMYFLFSKTKRIQWIPVTLSIVALLSIFGPWGAFAVSEKSQVGRLEKLLTENNILQNGKIVPVKDTISFFAEAEIASIIRYLDQSHGYKKIQPWFENDLEKLFAEKDSIDKYVYKPEIVLKEMGLQNNYGWRESDEEYYQKNFNYYATTESSILVSDYDELTQINVYSYNNLNEETKYIYLTSDTLLLVFNTDKDNYIIQRNNGDIITEFGMNDFVKNIKEKNGNHRTAYNRNIPAQYMYKKIDTETYRFKIFVRSIYGEIKDDKIKINGFDASLLIAYPKNAGRN